jgi:hypothetical protein
MAHRKRGYGTFFATTKGISRKNLQKTFDKIISRYGWRLKEIYCLTLEEFYEIVPIINEGIKEDFRDQMILQAYGSWQVIETLKGLLIGKDSKALEFKAYAKKMGLLEQDDPEESKLDIAIRIAERNIALQTAKEILEMDRKGLKND